MKYDELIEHIVGNARTYIEEYKNKEDLKEIEKGILLGLYMDLDSIKNHLIIDEEKTNINLDEIIEEINKIVNN